MKKILSLIVALMMVLSLSSMALAESDVIVVGTNPEFAPFEFVGDDGTIQGIDIDLITAIAAEMGKTVKIESMDFDALIPAMVSGKIDMAIAAMTIKEDRKMSVDFSEPYFGATQSIVVKEGSAIASAADLNGKKIGVQMGTTGDLFCTDAYPDAEVVRYTKAMDAIMDLAKGGIDAVVVDQGPAKVYGEQTPGLIVLADELSSEQYGIAMPKGSDELVAAVNAALKTLIENGKYDEILAKYN